MLDKIIVKAPGIIKLLGEHAVVYGKLSLAVAVSIYAEVSAKKVKNRLLTIRNADFKKVNKFSSAELTKMYKEYISKENIASYVEKNGAVEALMLPYATIAARLQEEFHITLVGYYLRIKSRIPSQSGLASSASCYTAFTVALAKASGAEIPDDKLVDVARDGERVSHLNVGAGAIDVNTSFYGGYVSFSKEQGAKRESLGISPKLLLINTGPKKPTSETVGNVARLYREQKEDTEMKLNRIEECSREGLKALKESNLRKLGKLMLEDQELLRQLGVSSPGLDKAVEIAMANGALGAKLSGGGGGGIAVALISGGARKLKEPLEKEGFTVYKAAKVSNQGAREYLHRQ